MMWEAFNLVMARHGKLSQTRRAPDVRLWSMPTVIKTTIIAKVGELRALRIRMDLILVCLFVFLADLCFWIPLSRLPALRQKLTDRIAGPKRKEKKSDIVDDHDLTGFAPPHKTRAIISIVVAAENILLLLYAFMNEKSIRGVSIGSGKLALANLFPLFLFGSHEIILVKVLRHSQLLEELMVPPQLQD
ncbi:hypothetical protein FocTR4_00016946 [Fusarium oxysporum f. sp. cubense]|uniref:Uncharacterized protein n=1 Tax=Fusarium oxysporum f. sp. cubense TaxID=61366 RepID=A0A5C6SJ45_FUSOC|nr:hypothetical protein FocTR4_00016946 [Fusarium oxysporum f. sp. cubense]